MTETMGIDFSHWNDNKDGDRIGVPIYKVVSTIDKRIEGLNEEYRQLRESGSFLDEQLSMIRRTIDTDIQFLEALKVEWERWKGGRE